MLKTPIVFLIFNRPDLTKIVFERIREAKPQKLLVVADGARFPEEEEKCQQAKSVIDRVDWNCELITNYASNNLGCKNRISSGLDWVFSQVEEAIILEDDCLPSQSFFFFCENLLQYYRDDFRVMHISGNNFQPKIMNEYSYYFSKYNHIWGWATWRRAWQYYDVNIASWNDAKKLNILKNICQNVYEQKFWTNIFDQVHNGTTINTWDYQWTYACWIHNGLSITPNVNLVSNFGFRSDATHTLDENSSFSQIPTTEIWDIKHPNFILQNPDADEYIFDNNYGGIYMKNSDTLIGKVKSFWSPYKKILFK